MATQQVLNDLQLSAATPRIERLRAHAIDRAFRGQDGGEQELLGARAWRKSAHVAGHLIRRGMLAGGILRELMPIIDADELLVGKYSFRALSGEETVELQSWRQYGQSAMEYANGQRAHMAVDYERVLRQGIAGTRQQIIRDRAKLDLTQAGDLAKDQFYQGCLVALDGVIALAKSYAELAESQATALDDGLRKTELLEIARICRKVPEFPAETFHEALQSIHFLTFCLCAGNQMLMFQFGRPDRYLLPLYRRDIAVGRITPDYAQELVDCLGILLNEYTPRGLAVGWMVGGRDESGQDITNELSYLFVQAVGHIRMAYPSVGLCWTPETPSSLMLLATRLLARGYSHPAVFNDEVITRGLLGLGLSHRDACLYIHSTCVEITPIAISNVYVASPYYNLTQCLHDVLGIPACGGSELSALADIPTFDDLLDRFRFRLREVIRQGVIQENTHMMGRAQVGGFPLLSCFVNDCLSCGKDIDQGGARVNWLESSFVGLANLVDALAAIRQLVYGERLLTLSRLREALLANFVGYADVQTLIARVPKYGMDDDQTDELAQVFTSFLLDECERYRSYWGDAVVPGFFCWIMHEQLGRMTTASADGRVAGYPFADGSGPAQGREILGPTAAIRSVTKWDHAPMIGGIAVNMRFQPTRDPDDLATPLRHMLETFLQLGGFEAQVNVVGSATLKSAQADPERYHDLVVRVAGYSDYFVGLSPEMQAQVIARAEMELS